MSPYKRYSRNSVSRFVPILLVIVITVVAVAAVIAIGRSLLGGGEDRPDTTTVQVDEAREALLSVDEGRSIRLTVRGPIVADEKFRSYRITISPDSRQMTIYEGYLDRQLKSKRLSNNVKAYEELVYALDKRGMMKGRVLTDEQNDLRGVCASKKLYEIETLIEGEVFKKQWTSDCDGAKGTSLANVAEIVDMFQKQIPDGKKMATEVGLAQQDMLFRL